MPRTNRQYTVVPGLTHHVWFRGNNRRSLFSYQYEYRSFLTYLHKAAIATSVKLHGFSLLRNHGHLHLTPPNQQALSKCMQLVQARYAYLRNQRRRASGKLFEERFQCKAIDNEAYLVAIHCYIDLNPLRAGLENELGVYMWSSLWMHLNFSKPKLEWLKRMFTPTDWYNDLGTDAETRAISYRNQLQDYLRSSRDEEFDRYAGLQEGKHAERRPNGTDATL